MIWGGPQLRYQWLFPVPGEGVWDPMIGRSCRHETRSPVSPLSPFLRRSKCVSSSLARPNPRQSRPLEGGSLITAMESVRVGEVGCPSSDDASLRRGQYTQFTLRCRQASPCLITSSSRPARNRRLLPSLASASSPSAEPHRRRFDFHIPPIAFGPPERPTARNAYAKP